MPQQTSVPPPENAMIGRLMVVIAFGALVTSVTHMLMSFNQFPCYSIVAYFKT